MRNDLMKKGVDSAHPVVMGYVLFSLPSPPHGCWAEIANFIIPHQHSLYLADSHTETVFLNFYEA
jgi:hypothetical protein